MLFNTYIFPARTHATLTSLTIFEGNKMRSGRRERCFSSSYITPRFNSSKVSLFRSHKKVTEVVVFLSQIFQVSFSFFYYFIISFFSFFLNKLFKPSYRTESYGKNLVIIGDFKCWNKTQNTLRNESVKLFYPNKIKIILTKRCIDKY